MRWPPSRPWRRARLPEPGSPRSAASEADRAFAVAYRYLGRRERTVAEVRARLEREELDPEAVEFAIGQLRESGYLDDARYARLFTQDKRELESWGRGRIERALADRGIAPDLIQAALDDFGTGRAAAATTNGTEAEQRQACELLRRRFPSAAADLRARERALGVLLRKGYEAEVAYDAVRQWAAGSDPS